MGTLVLAAIALAAGPPPAHAHKDQIVFDGGTLTYEQIPGLCCNPNNLVTITLKTDATGTYYEIDDPNSTGIVHPKQCTPLDSFDFSIRCPSNGVARLLVRTGTGDDSITVNAPTPATLYGGTGSNTMHGGAGPTAFHGEEGNNAMTAGAGGGNVLYGGLGSNTLNSDNGFADTDYYCPGHDTVMADSLDSVIARCPPPPPPPSPPPSPPPPVTAPAPSGAGTPTGPAAKAPTTTAPLIVHVALGPGVTLSYRRIQRILLHRGISVMVHASRSVTLRAQAVISRTGAARVLHLRTATARARAPHAIRRLVMRAPRSLVAPLRRLLAGRRPVFAVITISASAADGSSFALAREIRVEH